MARQDPCHNGERRCRIAQSGTLDFLGRSIYDSTAKMVTDKKGEEAVEEIKQWANRIAGLVNDKVQASVYYDPDSSTYVLRLAKGNRVLLFRLSEAQIGTPGREEECEKIVKRKVKDFPS